MDFNISRLNYFHNLDVLKYINVAEEIHETLKVEEKSNSFNVLPTYAIKPLFRLDFLEEWKAKIASWESKAITATIIIAIIILISVVFCVFKKCYTIKRILTNCKWICCKQNKSYIRARTDAETGEILRAEKGKEARPLSPITRQIITQTRMAKK